jgi:hypothetical protein
MVAFGWPVGARCSSAERARAPALRGGFCEDKLAGTLVLQEILLSELTLRDVDALGSLFDRWLLRELAAADRARVLAFTEDRLGEMSREAVRYVVERMPKSVQARVVSRHKLAGER